VKANWTSDPQYMDTLAGSGAQAGIQGFRITNTLTGANDNDNFVNMLRRVA
jgi:hypothetical protein